MLVAILSKLLLSNGTFPNRIEAGTKISSLLVLQQCVVANTLLALGIEGEGCPFNGRVDIEQAADIAVSVAFVADFHLQFLSILAVMVAPPRTFSLLVCGKGLAFGELPGG